MSKMLDEAVEDYLKKHEIKYYFFLEFPSPHTKAYSY